MCTTYSYTEWMLKLVLLFLTLLQFRMAKTQWSFGHSECNRVNNCSVIDTCKEGDWWIEIYIVDILIKNLQHNYEHCLLQSDLDLHWLHGNYRSFPKTFWYNVDIGIIELGQIYFDSHDKYTKVRNCTAVLLYLCVKEIHLNYSHLTYWNLHEFVKVMEMCAIKTLISVCNQCLFKWEMLAFSKKKRILVSG